MTAGAVLNQGRFVATLGDTQKVSREILRDPTGSLGRLFAQLGPDRALLVGGVFVLLFAATVAFMAKGVLSFVPFGIAPKTFPLAAGAVAFPVGIATFYSIVRAATRTSGSFSADLFAVSIAVLPLAVAAASVRLLGVRNIEILVIEAFIGFCITIILLFASAARMGGFSERAALIVVPLALLASAWGAKVISIALL